MNIISLCVLVAGFIGLAELQAVSTSSNRCFPNPCNGGICRLNANIYRGYACLCPRGRTGANCELKIVTVSNRCNPNPCNGGRCQLSAYHPVGYHCDCPQGRTGVNCETINRCNPNPCNGEICQLSVYHPVGYHCLCFQDRTGVNCETSLNRCNPNPCNGGICQLSTYHSVGYHCDCTQGRTGVNCETNDKCTAEAMSRCETILYSQVQGVTPRPQPAFLTCSPDGLPRLMQCLGEVASFCKSPQYSIKFNRFVKRMNDDVERYLTLCKN